MHPRIFTLGLSVEAISLYLILDDLDSRGAALTRDACSAYWNATAELFERSIDELVLQNILDVSGDTLSLRPATGWMEARAE